MRKELEQLVEDMKKVKKAEELLSTVSTTKMPSELNNLVDYALEHNILKDINDIVDIAIENPELKEMLSDRYNNHIKKQMDKIDERRKQAEHNYNYRYAGTYDSLSDVPGYGREWNERCVPDGVVVRGHNSRC